MDDRFYKARVTKIKTFVEENRTLAACALTAIVVAKITHDSVLDTCTKNAWPIIDELQRGNEELLIIANAMANFINHKGLSEEFAKDLTRQLKQ